MMDLELLFAATQLTGDSSSKPHNSEIDVPLIYSDYYYLESLLGKQKLDMGNKMF